MSQIPKGESAIQIRNLIVQFIAFSMFYDLFLYFFAPRTVQLKKINFSRGYTPNSPTGGCDFSLDPFSAYGYMPGATPDSGDLQCQPPYDCGLCTVLPLLATVSRLFISVFDSDTSSSVYCAQCSATEQITSRCRDAPYTGIRNIPRYYK